MKNKEAGIAEFVKAMTYPDSDGLDHIGAKQNALDMGATEDELDEAVQLALTSPALP
jgi:hypothetical protein